MATKVDICNLALGLCAELEITSLTDDSAQAEKCLLFLPQVTREVLRRNVWRSARKRAILVEDANAPAFGWDKSFILPSDFIRIASFNDVDVDLIRNEKYEIEGARLLTDESEAKISYVYDVTSESGDGGYGRLDPLCTRAIYTLLASHLAMFFKQNNALRESLLNEAEAVIKQAATVSAMDGNDPQPNVLEGSDWIESRY